MPEQEKPTIHGPINQGEADILFKESVDQAKAGPILGSIGALEAGQGAVALVTREVDGSETASHYVALDPADLGTRVRSERATEKGLPSPEAAHAQLLSTQRARVEQPSSKGPAQTEAERQREIAAADRQARKDKGLPPPAADLR